MRISFVVVLITASAFAAAGQAQTIQLPSIHQFSVDTTVIVPDSGHAWVAGDKRSASSSSTFGGISTQRAIGVERAAAGAAVTARIHDLEEADRAILKQAQARRAKADAAAPASRVASDLAIKANDPGLQSVAEIRRRRAEQVAAQNQETLALVEKARRASSEGKISAAAVYYRSAAREATGPLKQSIEIELRRLKAQSTSQSGQTARAAR